jgi:hypothetical protein
MRICASYEFSTSAAEYENLEVDRQREQRITANNTELWFWEAEDGDVLTADLLSYGESERR